MGKLLGTVKLENKLAIKINPATEDKQDMLIDEINKLAGFEIGDYDYMSMTYVATGNGIGQIETVTYKTGGAGGTTVATLTIAYDVNNKISSVTKS